jgi:hypothetical protein
MNPFIQTKHTALAFVVVLLLSSFGISHSLQAVVPAPDGGYPGGNTAEGTNALLSLTTGQYNTAVGFVSLASVTGGHYNTGIGAGALFVNTGDLNTATGYAALLLNEDGFNNTANGAVCSARICHLLHRRLQSKGHV